MDVAITQDHQIMMLNCVRIFTNLRDGRAAMAGIEPIADQPVRARESVLNNRGLARRDARRPHRQGRVRESALNAGISAAARLPRVFAPREMWKGAAVSIGLLALLDDVAAIAKVAAASLDDVAGQAAKAGAKAAGVVIDDAAVTPRYVVGFSAARELPIVGRIAIGSLRNKLLILLPAALALSVLLPSAITPLLMLGGAYLCYEGVEKVYEAVLPHHAHAHEARARHHRAERRRRWRTRRSRAPSRPTSFSRPRSWRSRWPRFPRRASEPGLVLALVGLGITVAVYGVVALIVKADDLGVALASSQRRRWAVLSRALGRALVLGMPGFLAFLGAAGTAAMIWVGGGIIVHGLETYGLRAVGDAIHADGRGRGPRGAAGSRGGRMDRHRGRVRHRRAGDRRSLHTARRIHRRAGMEAAQARAGASRAVNLPGDCLS